MVDHVPERLDKAGELGATSIGQIALSYDPDQRVAVKRAMEQVPLVHRRLESQRRAPGSGVVRGGVHDGARAGRVRADAVRSRRPPARRRDSPVRGGGFSHVALVQVGGDTQERFIRGGNRAAAHPPSGMTWFFERVGPVWGSVKLPLPGPCGRAVVQSARRGPIGATNERAVALNPRRHSTRNIRGVRRVGPWGAGPAPLLASFAGSSQRLDRPAGRWWTSCSLSRCNLEPPPVVNPPWSTGTVGPSTGPTLPATSVRVPVGRRLNFAPPSLHPTAGRAGRGATGGDHEGRPKLAAGRLRTSRPMLGTGWGWDGTRGETVVRSVKSPASAYPGSNPGPATSATTSADMVTARPRSRNPTGPGFAPISLPQTPCGRRAVSLAAGRTRPRSGRRPWGRSGGAGGCRCAGRARRRRRGAAARR